MTEKYYVEGVIEIDGTCGRVPDEDAEFFTLYERDEKGLSLCIADFTDRHSAESAMAVYQERDALQQQVNALAAEVLLMRNDPSFCAMMDALDAFYEVSEKETPEKGMLAAYKILIPKRVPCAESIKRQWMAEGLEEYGNMTVAIGREQKDLDIDYAGRQALLYAAQLRQPEEKGQ